MAFDERAVIQKAIERSVGEFRRIMAALLTAHPEVAQRGAAALLEPKQDAAAARKLRRELEDAPDLDSFLAQVETLMAERSEEEVLEALLPRRSIMAARVRQQEREPEREEGGNA